MASPYRAAHVQAELHAWLEDLPTALPSFEGERASRAGLSGPVTDLRVRGHQAVFRFDGHPMVHEVIGQSSVAIHTSVRRGLPFMHVVATDALTIDGSAFALAIITVPLLRLGRVANGTSLSVRDGLATLAWRHDISDEATHTIALECLVALRELHAPVELP